MRKELLYGLLLAGMGMSAFALDFSQNNRELTLKTEWLEAVVRDARIIQIRSRGSGKLFTDRALAESSVAAGLGRMTAENAGQSTIEKIMEYQTRKNLKER